MLLMLLVPIFDVKKKAGLSFFLPELFFYYCFGNFIHTFLSFLCTGSCIGHFFFWSLHFL